MTTYVAYNKMSPSEQLQFNRDRTFDEKYLLSEEAYLKELEGLIGEMSVGDVGEESVRQEGGNCTNLCSLN